MTYFAVGLAVIGAAAGLAFRWKVLLPVIVLLPFAAIILSVSHSLDLENAVIIVLVAEAILQGGYFVGLLIRSIAAAVMRSAGAAGLLESRRVSKTVDNDRHPAPQAGAGEGS
jgi:hypothetical protein